MSVLVVPEPPTLGTLGSLSPPPWGPCCQHCSHAGGVGLAVVLPVPSLRAVPLLQTEFCVPLFYSGDPPQVPQRAAAQVGKAVQSFVVAQASTAMTALPSSGGLVVWKKETFAGNSSSRLQTSD